MEQVFPTINAILDLWARVKPETAPKKPCPLCRFPKGHHKKCDTFNCRPYKQWVRHNHPRVFAMLRCGSGHSYDEHAYIPGKHGTAVDVLKELTQERLVELQSIVQAAVNRK
jgi:hypothetical protein